MYKVLYDDRILVQKQLKKRKTKIQFYFEIPLFSEECTLSFSPSVFYRYFLKKHLSNGSIYLNLTGATGFCISVLCCEILTLL